MSKSKGNVIDPLELLKKYPADLIRLYSVAKINFLQDGVCSEKLLRSFYQDPLICFSEVIEMHQVIGKVDRRNFA